MSKEVYQLLLDNVKFDLNTGPYMIGSYISYLIEKEIRVPSWQPGDIDIVCRTEQQILNLDSILAPLADTIDKTLSIPHKPVYVWSIKNFNIQSAVNDHNAYERIKYENGFADYTVAATASDGYSIVTTETTLKDIAEKTLRFNMSKEKWIAIYRNKNVNFTRQRYKRYKSRGYKDKDNIINNLITEFELLSKQGKLNNI